MTRYVLFRSGELKVINDLIVYVTKNPLGNAISALRCQRNKRGCKQNNVDAN